jgi:signal transduction histidine kinase
MVQRYRLTALLDELNEAHSQLQAHACQVEELAVARERNRMAREIHDTIGHYLTVVNVQIETAQKLRLRDPDRAESALDAAKKLATECLGEVRRSVAALRPQALEGSDLLQALGRLISELRRATRATIHVESQGEGTLPAAAEVVAYRSVQEALTNIRKHAHAKNVWVQMVWDPGWFTITIRDDGVGVDSDRLDEGYGLRGMRERLASVGGQLEIAAAGGRGMCLAISIPNAEEPAIEREQGGVAVAGG